MNANHQLPERDPYPETETTVSNPPTSPYWATLADLTRQTNSVTQYNTFNRDIIKELNTTLTQTTNDNHAELVHATEELTDAIRCVRKANNALLTLYERAKRSAQTTTNPAEEPKQ